MNPILLPSMVLALQSTGALGALGGLVPMLLIFVIFYVVLMLPMQRQRKALRQMIENLKKGDRVVTSGGRDKERFVWPVVRIVRESDGREAEGAQEDLFVRRDQVRPKRVLNPASLGPDVAPLVERALRTGGG